MVFCVGNLSDSMYDLRMANVKKGCFHFSSMPHGISPARQKRHWTESRHDAKIVALVAPEVVAYFRCHQWRQIWHHDNSGCWLHVFDEDLECVLQSIFNLLNWQIVIGFKDIIVYVFITTHICNVINVIVINYRLIIGLELSLEVVTMSSGCCHKRR